MGYVAEIVIMATGKFELILCDIILGGPESMYHFCCIFGIKNEYGACYKLDETLNLRAIRLNGIKWKAEVKYLDTTPEENKTKHCQQDTP